METVCVECAGRVETVCVECADLRNKLEEQRDIRETLVESVMQLKYALETERVCAKTYKKMKDDLYKNRDEIVRLRNKSIELEKQVALLTNDKINAEMNL